MNSKIQNLKPVSIFSFILFASVSVVHIVFTNLEGSYFNYTKALLMPTLALFFILTVKDLKKGWPIL